MQELNCLATFARSICGGRDPVEPDAVRKEPGMIRPIKNALWRFIARNRRSSAVRVLHKFSHFVNDAYRNNGLNPAIDGEYHIINRLRDAKFRVVFDVGANCGDWMMEVLKAWPHCHLHAFEVAPGTARSLAERIGQSTYCSRVTLNALGLSNFNGTMEMYYVPDYPNVTTALRLARALQSENYVAIPFNASLRTGDAYMTDHGIEAADFVKIDVEGAEYHVLEGFKESLSRAKVHCLQFEYCPFAIQTKLLLADFYSLLSEHLDFGRCTPTMWISESMSGPSRSSNLQITAPFRNNGRTYAIPLTGRYAEPQGSA